MTEHQWQITGIETYVIDKEKLINPGYKQANVRLMSTPFAQTKKESNVKMFFMKFLDSLSYGMDQLWSSQRRGQCKDVSLNISYVKLEKLGTF